MYVKDNKLNLYWVSVYVYTCGGVGQTEREEEWFRSGKPTH